MALIIITEKSIGVNMALVVKMINYVILSDTEKYSRYSNMKARCGKEYQDRNPRYYGTFMWKEWLHDKNKFYKWLDNNFYEVNGEQMDIDKDILCYGNKQYHKDLILVVPHSVNSFYENIEVGKTNITYNTKTKKYRVKVSDDKKSIVSGDIVSYNEALDIFCDIKQAILFRKAKSLQSQIPDKVYQAMMNTDIKAINAMHYEIVE